MAKKDNWKRTLMFNCNVKLKCDDEILKCKYTKHQWNINGVDTGKGVLSLIEELREKYLDPVEQFKKEEIGQVDYEQLTFF